ncbi:MAG: putative extracellular nuclease [Phenylobacterium sp.]|jgi:predicted extracellular nuclease
MINSIKRSITCLIVLLAMAANFAQCAQAASVDSVFISEYVEGSRFNKAIELYNGTAQAIDLSEYRLDFYLNGAQEVNISSQLSGILTPNTTYVVANSRAASEILIVTDFTSDGIWFDGDDVVVLTHNDQVIDSVGQVGSSHDETWAGGSDRTKHRTMRRLSSMVRPDTNIHDDVNHEKQWLDYDENSFCGLGTYLTTERANYAYGDATSRDVLEFVEPAQAQAQLPNFSEGPGTNVVSKK